MNDKKSPRRKSPRLNGYDYSQNGVYFVTICTHHRKNLFGHVDKEGIMHRNMYGNIAHKCWLDIPDHFTNIDLDQFVIMPNHMHGIVFLSEPQSLNAGERHASPLHPKPSYRVKSGSLIAMVGSYKSAVTKRINLERQSNTPPVWQRSFHDHIIRDEQQLSKLREYTLYNPGLWAEDRYYSDT